MPVRTGLKAVTVLLLVLSLGLHWALLQTVAWTGMLITYSRDASFQEAVVMTFDAQHPCPLCQVIKTGRAEQKKHEQQQVKPGFKLELALVWQACDFILRCDGEPIAAPDLFALSRPYEPPKPRPRGMSPVRLASA
jgi:hypothetical protein